MDKANLPISWRGKIVGGLGDVKIDNFDVYGKWSPRDDPSTEQFLAELETVGEVVVRISLNETKWLETVKLIPRINIEIKIRPHLEAIWEEQSR